MRGRHRHRDRLREDSRYVAVDDIGIVVNLMIVDGQVHGGVTQGVAQALYEEAVYDEDGNLITGTMVDYLVLAARRTCRRGRWSGHHALDDELVSVSSGVWRVGTICIDARCRQRRRRCPPSVRRH